MPALPPAAQFPFAPFPEPRGAVFRDLRSLRTALTNSSIEEGPLHAEKYGDSISSLIASPVNLCSECVWGPCGPSRDSSHAGREIKPRGRIKGNK